MAVQTVHIAFPEWTEYRTKNGLDPLGMQTSSVSLYQDLLPGISNVTLRIRYYGLYAWLCDTYAKNIGDTDPGSWQRFVRRAEALYALASERHGGETGVAGIRWARRRLQSNGQGSLDFAQDAEPGSSTHYLKQAWGAYGAAYASQLHEVGVFGAAEGHEIPVPGPNFGDSLVSAFSDGRKKTLKLYFDVIERGKASLEELDALYSITPSEISSTSDEREWYEKILFANAGLSRDSDIARKRTLLLVLSLAKQLDRMPTPFDVRWFLYAGHESSGQRLDIEGPEQTHQRLRWWLYQANDLAHIGYETLLKFVLDILETHPNGITLQQLVSEAVQNLKGAVDVWPDDWLAFMGGNVPVQNAAADSDMAADKTICTAVLEAARPKSVCSADGAWYALRLLAIVHSRVRSGGQEVEDEMAALRPEPFRSLQTEVRFLEERIHQNFSQLVASLIEGRVLRRHLWVAMKKLRYQGDYTFLIETDNGLVRLRSKDGPVFTNPRLGPAIRFLSDIHLIGNEGLTELGQSVLGAA